MGKSCVQGGAPGELTLCVKLSADITKCIDHDRRQTCLRFVCAFRSFAFYYRKDKMKQIAPLFEVFGGGGSVKTRNQNLVPSHQ